MKKICFIITFSACCVLATAQQYEIQKGSEISLGISAMQPLGSFHQDYKMGFGIDLKYAYNFNKTLAATASAGYNFFNGRTIIIPDGSRNFHYIPMKLGARFTHQIFYIEPQLGAATAKSGDYYTATFFLYAAQIGVIPIKNLDVSLRYEGLVSANNSNNYFGDGGSVNTFSLRAACRLPFGNK